MEKLFIVKKMMNFDEIFNSVSPNRDKFLSRIFGIFAEEIIRIWCNDKRSTYENLGRPSIYSPPNNRRPSTLDFTFRERNNTNKIYIVEMKCWLEYERYKFLPLECVNFPGVIRIMNNSKGFKEFLKLAQRPNDDNVRISYKAITGDVVNNVQIAGAILIWSKVDALNISRLKLTYRFADVLSLEGICNELISWENTEYCELMNKKKNWCDFLFNKLLNI